MNGPVAPVPEAVTLHDGGGYAPWEVRVECKSLDEARDLADQLRSEGYGVSRTFTYVIAGTTTREQAVELARAIHGEVEPGGELAFTLEVSVGEMELPTYAWEGVYRDAAGQERLRFLRGQDLRFRPWDAVEVRS